MSDIRSPAVKRSVLVWRGRAMFRGARPLTRRGVGGSSPLVIDDLWMSRTGDFVWPVGTGIANRRLQEWGFVASVSVIES
jgi:hypothetical protein